MKILEFIIGLLVLFMGLVPYLARVESLSDKVAGLGSPGSTIYQGILIVIGILTILYSISAGKRRRD